MPNAVLNYIVLHFVIRRHRSTRLRDTGRFLLPVSKAPDKARRKTCDSPRGGKSDQLIKDRRCAARCSDYAKALSATRACPSEILLFTFYCDNILKA